MKTFYLIFLILFINVYSQNSPCIVKISEKKVDLCRRYDRALIIKTFGNPVKVEKEQITQTEGDEKPWSVYSYNGMTVTLTGKYIEEIVITNLKWSVNGINLKTSLKTLNENYLLYKKNDDINIYQISKSSDMLIYVQHDKRRIIKLGISSP